MPLDPKNAADKHWPGKAGANVDLTASKAALRRVGQDMADDSGRFWPDQDHS